MPAVLENTLFVVGPTIYSGEAIQEVEYRVKRAVADLGIRTETIQISERSIPYLGDCPYGPALDMYQDDTFTYFRESIAASRGIVIANMVPHHHEYGVLQNAIGSTVARLIDHEANRGKIFLAKRKPLVSGQGPAHEEWDRTRGLLEELGAVTFNGKLDVLRKSLNVARSMAE